MALEQKVKFDPSRAEKAFQQQRFSDGWCAAVIRNPQPSQAPDVNGETVSPNYIQLQFDLNPLEDPNNDESAVSRGMRKWQTLPFEPDHWQEALAAETISEQTMDEWQAELDSSQKETYRLARAFWPDDVPDLPRREGSSLVYDGEEIESTEYEAAAADAVLKGCEKMGQVINAGGIESVEGRRVYPKLGNMKKDRTLAKRTYINLILGEHPTNQETGQPEVLNQGAALYYKAPSVQGNSEEEAPAPAAKPQVAKNSKPAAVPARSKPTARKGK